MSEVEHKTLLNKGGTRKNRGSPTKGWIAPGAHERTLMMSRCGKKCFLGTRKSFPICSRYSCKVNRRGLYSAYVRAREYRRNGSKYRAISSKAKKMLIRMKAKR